MRKPFEILNSGNKRSDAVISSSLVDASSLFGRAVPHLHLRREKEAIDEMFQALLAEANRELASLLRDVGTWPHGALSGGTQNQSLGELLMRAVRCATKQYMLQAELGNLALTDELTGLYNRRGFQALADRQLKLGRRSGRGMLLFFVDVNGLKQINDSFGHAEGDVVLMRTAETLEKTFRDSDVIARLGGDEFAVLAIEALDYSEARIRERLSEYLKMLNAKESRYVISLSLGVVRFDPGTRASICDLMARADRAMYEGKRGTPRPSITVQKDYQTQ
jgi:diguanylate cyclase (GGDEF)-like protein